MLDSIVIGTGPAGLSAALNLKIYNKTFMWFGSKALSDKGRRADKIVNYPGFPEISGEELFARFETHIKAAGLEISEKSVTSVMSAGDYYMVLADNEVYESRTVILCTGAAAVKTFEGEDELLGRGVSYCATCDGMFYKGKIIAVYTNSARFEHEVEYLAGLASHVVCFPAYKNYSFNAGNITVSQDFPVKVNGAGKVGSLTLRSGETLTVDGFFCLRNAMEPAKLIPGIELIEGSIAVDRTQRTNLIGVYAAGDCTGRPYQYTKAVGEGNVAAHSCIEYLAENKAKSRV